MASRIILDPETLLAQAGEMQSLTAEYESLFSKVTGTLNDTNNNWSELLAHNFAGKISSAQQSFASITELLASGAAAAKNSATTMQSVDQSLFKVFGGEAGEGIISGQVQGIVHLSLNTEDGDDSYIEWADGRTGENVKTQIDGNQFTLTWDSTYRYNYDLGESEEGEGGKITGIFLITNRPNGGMDGGLSICVDGKWYPYVYDSTAYWNGELSDNLETDADVSSMSEDELGELKENQTAVSSGLMGAFKEQGLDSTKIDESTGTVQMDNNVLFAWDKADLSEEGKAYLDQFLAAYVPVISSAIEDGKVSTIVVEGYTDSAGDEAYNLKLSQERAKTVADYIKAGYPELTNAIEVVGNGANNLILDGEGKEDAAASRRVEVRYVLKTE